MNVHVKKTVPIEYSQVAAAYAKVRQGGKAKGIDEESWAEFDKKAQHNLYVIWNRLASGSYYPQAVREVEIPKKDGKMRKLGIPTVRDRIAQQVVKEYMERRIDSQFHENSYGYRPLKSAHDAIEQVRQNSFKQDWVIDMDISKFFDEIDHELMLKAVTHVIEDKWVLMYVERWLQMPIQKTDGTLQQKEGKGTPQGGVISPLLANLYLHFTLDMWLTKNYPQVSFVRYADDVVIHCNSKAEAEKVMEAIKHRLQEAKLRVNETKTRIAYCQDFLRKEKHENVQFGFLGYSYQPRTRRSKTGKPYIAFTPEISQDNQKKIKDEIRESKLWQNTTIEITTIARALNVKLRGWINYYGKYSKGSLRKTIGMIDTRLIKWIGKKYKIGVWKSVSKLKQWKKENRKLFYHWEMGY